MVFIGPISSIFDYATFFLMLYFFGCAAFGAAGNPGGRTRAIWKSSSTPAGSSSRLLTQTLIVHIIRTQRIPFIQSRASKTMLFATLTIMAVGAWLPFPPLAPFLGLVPLPPVFFAWMAGFLLAYGILTHTVKMWFYRRFGSD